MVEYGQRYEIAGSDSITQIEHERNLTKINKSAFLLPLIEKSRQICIFNTNLSGMKTVQAHDLHFSLFLTEEDIQRRVQELGARLRAQYGDKRPVFLGVLNGSFMFAADLVRAFGADCELSFIKLSSYRGLQSTGDVSTLIGLEANLQDRHVIILEDIVDTGKTLYSLLPDLQRLQPASIAIAALLQKPDMLEFPLEVQYVGFSIPPHFVIGYGLDYNELGRQLPAIYQLIK